MSTVVWGTMWAMAPPLVLLHGFAGTGRSWDPVAAALGSRAYVVAPDLRGHGTAAGRRPITWDAVVGDVVDALGDGAVLAGYSMGGRLALHAALRAPGRVRGLALLATTAGLEAPDDRTRRRAADGELAAFARTASPDAFAERWMATPVFAGTPPEAAARWREDLLRTPPPALAEVLTGLGAAEMPPVWDRLGELAMPVAVAAGRRDARYVALAERLAAALPDATLTVVPGAGHGLPREAPEAVAEVLARLLDRVR